MKLLTAETSREWLALRSLSISSDRDVLAAKAQRVPSENAVFAHFPKDGTKLADLAASLASWHPSNRERLLWLKNWDDNPYYKIPLFNAIHKGENPDALIVQPSMLFSPSQGAEDARGDDWMLSGFLLLIMCFDWECYVVSGDDGDRIYISDEYVMFLSDDHRMVERGKLIFNEYGMVPLLPKRR